MSCIGTLVSKKTILVECGVVRMREPVSATITVYFIPMSKWISPSSSVTSKKIWTQSFQQFCERWYWGQFLFCFVKFHIVHCQCVDQCVDRIGLIICFLWWYLRWDMYSQKLWCHPSAHHIEEPYCSIHHKSYLVFIIQETCAHWYFYLWMPLTSLLYYPWHNTCCLL